MSQVANREDIEQLRKLILDIRFAMVTTVHGDGTLRSRPLTTLEMDPDGTLWFLLPIDGDAAEEVQRDHQVNIAYASQDDMTYVSVSGRGKVGQDKDKIDELWNPAAEAYFPEGKDSPEVAVLEVTVTGAEYWDAPSSAMVRLFHYVKGIVSDSPPDMGEHGAVRVNA